MCDSLSTAGSANRLTVDEESLLHGTMHDKRKQADPHSGYRVDVTNLFGEIFRRTTSILQLGHVDTVNRNTEVKLHFENYLNSIHTRTPLVF